MNPIQFYTSVDVTLSEKLLEVMYCLIGLISIYVAFKNLKDKENKNSVGSFVFWFDLGVMFVLGKWLPALADGILLIILVLPPILKKVSPGNEPEPTLDEMEQNNKKIGAKVFVPAVCIGLFALLAAFFTKISPLVATQASTPIASIQQNADAQSILHSQNALHETQEQEREVRETVVQKEEAAYYEQSPDAKEEGKNKYQNLYSGKKKKTKTEDTETHTGINRVNIDLKI